MAPRLALNEVALELSGTWVLIKSVKTTSDCIVDLLAKKIFLKKLSLKEESSCNTAWERHFSSDHRETNQCKTGEFTKALVLGCYL